MYNLHVGNEIRVSSPSLKEINSKACYLLGIYHPIGISGDTPQENARVATMMAYYKRFLEKATPRQPNLVRAEWIVRMHRREIDEILDRAGCTYHRRIVWR